MLIDAEAEGEAEEGAPSISPFAASAVAPCPTTVGEGGIAACPSNARDRLGLSDAEPISTRPPDEGETEARRGECESVWECRRCEVLRTTHPSPTAAMQSKRAIAAEGLPALLPAAAAAANVGEGEARRFIGGGVRSPDQLPLPTRLPSAAARAIPSPLLLARPPPPPPVAAAADAKAARPLAERNDEEATWRRWTEDAADAEADPEALLSAALTLVAAPAVAAVEQEAARTGFSTVSTIIEGDGMRINGVLASNGKGGGKAPSALFPALVIFGDGAAVAIAPPLSPPTEPFAAPPFFGEGPCVEGASAGAGSEKNW